MNDEMMERMLDLLRHVDRIILISLKTVSIICFILLTILVSANVVVRFLPFLSLHWFDEIVELLYAYLVFYGAAALWINKEHFSVGNWMSGRIIKSAEGNRLYRLVLELFELMFAAVFLYYSLRLTMLAIDVTNVFAIPKRVLYSCMPISASIMVWYSLRNIAIQITELAKVKNNGPRKLT
jgi:TRAP-type transport system small permease protein